MSVLDGPREEIRRIYHEGTPQWVTLDGSELVLGDGRRAQEADANYLPPCDPTKILCIHLNFDSRRAEFKAPALVTPTYFQKPLTTMNSHRGKLYRPADCKYINYEGEVGVVIGKPMRNVSGDDVWNYIAGFTPVNDVGIHDFRDTDAGSMLRVKGMDGFCPTGPGLVRGVDIRKETLRTYINGKVVQEDPMSNMTFDIPYILGDLCRYITLMPGDLIVTGTPANSRPMADGDVVEVEVTGVGKLTNTVAECPAAVNEVGFPPTISKNTLRVALAGDWFKENPDDTRATQ